MTFMDVLSELALTALDDAVTELLPSSVPNGLTRNVRVVPSEVRASGLGGYVGMHAEPRGAVLARRVRATLELAVSGGNDADASGYLDQMVRGFLSQQQGDLRREGIQRIMLDSAALQARSAKLELDYEYRHLPTESEGVIDILDLNLEVNLTPYRVKYRWDLATRTLVGAPQPLADFQVADDPNVDNGSPASQWTFNGAQARIEQNALTRGGPLDLSQPKKAGAQLLWRPGGVAFKLGRFIAAVDFESASSDGIGVVFGRKDAQNFWYFLASEHHRYHLFGRKSAGAYAIAGTPAADVGFALDSRHVLMLVVHDQTLIAELDGVRTLKVEADAPVDFGEIGFLTHGNNQARFHRARLIELV
jgi:hypothetical protein